MFSLPLSSLFIVFGIFVFIFFFFFYINTRELTMNFAMNGSALIITALILLLSIVTTIIGAYHAAAVDWQAPLFSINTASFGYLQN